MVKSIKRPGKLPDLPKDTKGPTNVTNKKREAQNRVGLISTEELAESSDWEYHILYI